MKKILIPVLSLFALAACEKNTTVKNPELVTAEDSVSYALGINIGESLQKQGIENLNTDIVAAAIQQAFADDTTAMFDNETAVEYLNGYFQRKQMADMEKAKEEGKNFLAETAKKPGITITASGLQYEVIKEGSGAIPIDTSSVTVHYRGALIDGTVFEDSYKNNQPVTFKVNEVIPGWAEALMLMKEGASYKLYIPSELGFGAMGGGPIPANSVLIFDVELISVNP